jgi:hypothetical protein
MIGTAHIASGLNFFSAEKAMVFGGKSDRMLSACEVTEVL